MGVETGLIIAMAASAAASLGSAAVGYMNNSNSLKAQQDMYDKQRADQLSDYENRTGIKAQLQQYQDMGINPVAAIGNVSSGSMPSVPAASEVPKLENYGSTLGAGVVNTMEALAKIKGFQKQDAEVQNLLSQQRLTELQSSYQQGQNFLQQKYGDSEHALSLRKMYADTMLSFAEGRYKDSYMSLNSMIEKLKGEEFKHMQTENSQFGLILAQQLNLVKAQVETEKQKAKTEISQQRSNYAGANLSDKQAFGQDISNQLQSIELDRESSPLVKARKLDALVASLSKSKMYDDAEKEKFKTQLSRYKQLNKNDENAISEYVNYTLWFIKQNIEGLGILIPFGKK